MKSTEILHVFGPQFFGGVLPEFLESIYEIDTGSDHVEKFRGDRPRELGDYALKKRNITSKIEDLPLLRTGGLIAHSTSITLIQNNARHDWLSIGSEITNLSTGNSDFVTSVSACEYVTLADRTII